MNPLTGKLIWDQRVGVGTKAIKEKPPLRPTSSRTAWSRSGSSNYLASQKEQNLMQALSFLIKRKATTCASRRWPSTILCSGATWCASGCPMTSTFGSTACHKRQTLQSTMGWERVTWPSTTKAMPLWLRASCQVIHGPKLQVYLGCAPAEHRMTDKWIIIWLGK